MKLLREKYTVTSILNVLGVPGATYYRWCAKGVVKHPSVLEEAIIELCKQTKYRNGHRKIKALVEQTYRLSANRNTIQRIMKKYHFQCRKPKRIWKSQGERVIVAPDLLQRDFTASEPNQKWVTDITYIQYGSTTKYLSTIMDLFNNEIVAYKLYEHQQTPLVMDMLKKDAGITPKGSSSIRIKEVSICPMPSKSS